MDTRPNGAIQTERSSKKGFKMGTATRADRWARAIRGMGVALIALLLVGCDGLLDVDLPTNVPEGVLTDPAMASTLVLSAQGDFECALGEYIHSFGAWTDELISAGGWLDTNAWVVRRSHDADGGGGNCPTTLFRGNYNVYQPLQLARGQGERAYGIISEHAPGELPEDREDLLARAAFYSAYATTHLGEAFCEMALDEGPIISPAEALAAAEARFSDAIDHAQAAGNTEVMHAAQVGRARVRLGMGDGAGAVADASAVPEGFVFYATYSTSVARRSNHVYLNNNANEAVSVDPRYRNLEIDGVPDPRVPVRDTGGNGIDGTTPMWVQEKYTSLGDDIPLATWQEAQLIIAEAQGGQAAVDAINRLRQAAELPLFESSDEAEIRAEMIEERRRELFLQGNRIGDMLRLGLPFDTGSDHKGQAYVEDATCMPLPVAETQNM